MAASRPSDGLPAASEPDCGRKNPMLQIYTRVRALWATRDRGATAVEYALIVAVIAMVVVVAAITLGDKISDLFGAASDCVETPSAADCGTPSG